MSTTTPDIEIELNPTEEDILREINAHGRATAALIANVLDKNKTYVNSKIRRLREHGYLVEVAPRLYDTPEQASEYLDD